MEEFYVYIYRNPLKNNEPFYVGKGKGGRAYEHLAEARLDKGEGNRHKINTIKQILNSGLEPLIEFADKGISEEDAFELEVFLISEIGRRDLGTGPLTNLTAGGEGLSGLVRDLSGENNPNYGKRGESAVWWGREHSEETKHKIRLAHLGRVLTEEHKSKMRKPKSEEGRKAIVQARLGSDYTPTEDHKKKISVALTGRASPMKGNQHSEDAKQKMSESHRGKPSARKGRTFDLPEESVEHLRQALKERNEQVVTCPRCGKTGKYTAMIRWHMNNCREKNNAT